ncbi:MAG: hypothetical protein EOP49_16440 [Sphingobacteriales bacterium]|nr:MAG: hypothetical protein EOP49_16440 [Sphingobacteriales bacterium]
MKRLFVCLALGLCLISCDHKRDTEKLRQVFAQTNYDDELLKGLPLYDSLKNIIMSNMDTIFKFRNSRHFVYHGDTGKETREDADHYMFFYNYGEAASLSYGTGPDDQKLIDEVSVENMPAFIFPSVDSIFKKLGKDRIRGFTLWEDSTIEISIKGYRKKEIDVSHELIWKRSYSKNTDHDLFYKDTMITPRWTYLISVDEHQGW